MKHKINQIKRLIESLDPYEVKELVGYLMEEVDMDEDINNLSTVKIAVKIENGELPETKELLMRADKKGWTVAHWLAYDSYKTKWKTNDKDILMLQINTGWSVAHELAKRYPTWTTNDPRILNLIDYKGKTVEACLREEGKI